MILGRPTNLWNGLVVAAVSLVSIVVMQLHISDVDSEVVATIGAAVSLFAGAVIAIIANQPPTVNSGDTITVVTPAGTPNETRTVE
jgi:hypothetical protein